MQSLLPFHTILSERCENALQEGSQSLLLFRRATAYRWVASCLLRDLFTIASFFPKRKNVFSILSSQISSPLPSYVSVTSCSLRYAHNKATDHC